TKHSLGYAHCYLRTESFLFLFQRTVSHLLNEGGIQWLTAFLSRIFSGFFGRRGDRRMTMLFSESLFVHSPSVSDRVVALPSLHLEWLAILLTRDADVSIASIQCGIRWGVGGLV